MSYEGYEEFLCQWGHYWVEDAYFSFELTEVKCPRCRQKAAYYHSVNQTNGEDLNDPSTMSALSDPIGYSDWWQEDQRTKKIYFCKIPVYFPNENWKRITPIHEEQ